MTVYCHPLVQCVPNAKWRWTSSTHLVADTLDELHAFAVKIGLRREWFQGDGRLPHYDLNPGRFHAAVRAGVTVIERREFAERFLGRSPATSDKPAPTSITADDLDRIVYRLSNQSWVRYFLTVRPGYVLLSVMNAEGYPDKVLESDMTRKGFKRCHDSGMPGEIWIAKLERAAPSTLLRAGGGAA